MLSPENIINDATRMLMIFLHPFRPVESLSSALLALRLAATIAVAAPANIERMNIREINEYFSLSPSAALEYTDFVKPAEIFVPNHMSPLADNFKIGSTNIKTSTDVTKLTSKFLRNSGSLIMGATQFVEPQISRSNA